MLDFSFHNFGCDVYSKTKQYFKIVYTPTKRTRITVMDQENTQAEQKAFQVAFVSNFDRRCLTFVCVGIALQLSALSMLVRLALIQFISTM